MVSPDQPADAPDLAQDPVLRIQGAAHDLNQLLGIILGRAQHLILRDPDSPAVAELEVIVSAAKDGAAILREALDDPAADRSFSRRLVALDELVADCLERIRHLREGLARERSVRFDISAEVPSDLRAEVRPVALREVVTNLLVNSLEAMPHGGRLDIRARPGPGSVHLFVEDNGCGMDERTCAQVFQAGFSAGKPDGRGLGLAVCKRLIAQMGGRIRVRSELGEGTRFEVILPRARRTGRDLEVPPSPDTGGDPVDKLRVLVVDNELRIRQVVADLLGADGHRVVPVAGGQEALGTLRPREFDVVLVDWNMPGLSGLELIKALRKLDASVALVVMTGWGEPALREVAESPLVDLSVTKPLDLQALRGLIASAATIGRRRREAAAAE